ncbi:MAG: PQQ-binding-like beta-propeller repeat protein, partial [Candidatus Bathyarchaeota archaeon]|nr:PQQ-binding-like beta-propeller repeat protein [Candidatus Termiticorpusculum sp.]
VVNAGTPEEPDYMLRQWNSSTVVALSGSAWGSQVSQNTGPREYNATTRGYDFNISLPRNLGTPIMVFPTDRAIFANVSSAGVTLSAVSLDENNFGVMLFNQKYWQPAAGEWEGISIGGSETQTGWAAFSSEPYVGVFWTKENRVNYIFSLETGNLLWQSEPQIYADGWGGATSNSSPEKVIAYGKLFEASVGGIVYCYDVATGEVLWTYEAVDTYGESYTTANWWLCLCFVSDGKIYLGHYEHSSLEPKPRGAPFFALNVEDGTIAWEIYGAFRQLAWGGRAIIGDSIIATIDSYDSQIYAIGKGPTSITVSTPNTAVTVGKPILITGTIMDISPGTQSDRLQLRFPRGVPAMADEDMSEWMLYVYKNFDLAKNVNGVSIDLWAFDPNGNEIPIGETVSDAQGNFAIQFTPEIEGQYDIFAFFYGSKAYYGDYTNTGLLATEAPDGIVSYELYIIGMGIAIIITVIIACLLILRKK